MAETVKVKSEEVTSNPSPVLRPLKILVHADWG
jgi:hypothetical protein